MNNSGLKINLFDTPLETQYVRLVPIICHRGCTLRFELLGCELNGECQWLCRPWRWLFLSPLFSARVRSWVGRQQSLGTWANTEGSPGLRQSCPGATFSRSWLVRGKKDFSCGSVIKNSPAMQETRVRSLDWEKPLEKGMATHSSILA